MARVLSIVGRLSKALMLKPCRWDLELDATPWMTSTVIITGTMSRTTKAEQLFL